MVKQWVALNSIVIAATSDFGIRSIIDHALPTLSQIRNTTNFRMLLMAASRMPWLTEITTERACGGAISKCENCGSARSASVCMWKRNHVSDSDSFLLMKSEHLTSWGRHTIIRKVKTVLHQLIDYFCRAETALPGATVKNLLHAAGWLSYPYLQAIKWNTGIEIRDEGKLRYDPSLFSPDEADDILAYLLKDVAWKQEVVQGFPLPRLNAWYSDPGLKYEYSGVTQEGGEWTDQLLRIKDRVQSFSDTKFNSMLLNRYRDGGDSIGFHTDAEPELGVNPLVATVSFGSPREFVLKHRKKKKDRMSYQLPHGSCPGDGRRKPASLAARRAQIRRARG